MMPCARSSTASTTSNRLLLPDIQIAKAFEGIDVDEDERGMMTKWPRCRSPRVMRRFRPPS